MTSLIISALATAFVVGAVDELIVSLGKFRGLVALLIAAPAAYYTGNGNVGIIVFTSLAAAFLALTSTVLVESISPREIARFERGLPRRVPPL